MFKDIMVAMTRSSSDASALMTGVHLARHDQAHLAVIIPVEFPVPTPNEWGVYPYQMYSSFYETALAAAEALAERLRTQLSREDIKFSVRVESTILMNGAQTCAMHARYCDIAIVGGEIPGEKSFAIETHFLELLMNSGRPVLRVPHTLQSDYSFDRVLIAWQPIPEASRAVHDAMPFLLRAKHVEILMIDPQIGESAHGEQPGADIATHLARHGLNVVVTTLPAMGETVGAAVLEYARLMDMKLLIAGGYSHSRLRELVLGGVTRELNAHSQIPILFAH